MALIFNKPLLMLFGASDDTIGYACDYMNIYAIGTLFVQVTLGMNAYITAQGYSNAFLGRTPIGEKEESIYDVEFVKEAGTFYLRAFIDKEDGITINDCETVSRRLSDLLDQKDFIPDSYILEVSSPGLGRQLKKDKHLEKSIGEEVELKLFKAIEKQKEFSGILESFTEEVLVIQEENGTLMEFERSNIAMIRLSIHF